MLHHRIVMSVTCLFLVFGFTGISSYSQTSWQSVSDFNRVKNQKPVKERVSMCFELLKTESNSAILTECFKDIAKFARFKNNDAEVIADLDQFIQRNNVDAAAIQKAQLVKARILRRINNPEGETLFTKAIQEKWAGAELAYYDSLEETKEYEKRANFVLQQWYAYDKDKDMFYIGTVFRQWKRFQKDRSFSESVYPQLPLSDTLPQSGSLLKGWCLIFDEKYPEAIQEFLAAKTGLVEIPDITDKKLNSSFREAENVLLYLALAYFLGGEDIQTALNYTQQYLNTAKTEPKLRLQRVLSIAWYLQNHSSLKPQEFMPMHLKLVQLLLESDLAKNPDLSSKLDPDWMAGLYDMQQLALAWTGRASEGEAVCLKGMNLYYPRTFAGANMAKCYAASLYEKKQYKESEDLLQNVLDNTNWDELIPSVKYLLVKALLGQGKVKETYPLLEDILAWGEISTARIDQDITGKAEFLYNHLKECEAEGRDYRLYKPAEGKSMEKK